jgi:hypothetical protein
VPASWWIIAGRRPAAEPVLETLVTLDWVGRLDEAGADAEARYVMLASLPSRRWSRWCRLLLSRCRQPARSGQPGCRTFAG